MKGKKTSTGKVVVLTTAGAVFLVFGGTADADPNEGVLAIESFLNAEASADEVRGVRYSDDYYRNSSSPITSGEHNVTSFFCWRR